MQKNITLVMKAMSTRIDIHHLTVEERLALLGEIWDSLRPEDLPLTRDQRAELDRRLDDLETDPNPGIPWDTVLRKIRDRRK